jgi:2-methylcitrate dehydratase PrpD
VPNGYAAKFSTPYCVAVGFLDGKAGFEQFTDERVRDPRVRALAATVSYVIDPNNDYPRNFSGHIRATLRDGTVREVRKPHMRGGAHEPLTQSEIEAKFRDNVRFGGWDARRAAQLGEAIDRMLGGATADLSAARA